MIKYDNIMSFTTKYGVLFPLVGALGYLSTPLGLLGSTALGTTFSTQIASGVALICGAAAFSSLVKDYEHDVNTPHSFDVKTNVNKSQHETSSEATTGGKANKYPSSFSERFNAQIQALVKGAIAVGIAGLGFALVKQLIPSLMPTMLSRFTIDNPNASRVISSATAFGLTATAATFTPGSFFDHDKVTAKFSTHTR